MIPSLDSEKTPLRRVLKRQLKRCLQYEKNCTLQLFEAKKWPKFEHEAQLLQASFHLLKKGLSKIKVKDWDLDECEVEILLDPAKEASENIANLYLRAKKGRKAIPHLESQLALVKENLLVLNQQLEALENATTLEELSTFQKPQKVTKIKEIMAPVEPFHIFYSEDGSKILVGKNAKGNESLTFQYAHGSDYWFHVHGMPGSHVVLKTGKNKEPADDAILDAMHLAIFYSRAKNNGEGEVIYAQRKYVSKGSQKEPGKVQISEHKSRHIRLDLQRIAEIKKRTLK